MSTKKIWRLKEIKNTTVERLVKEMNISPILAVLLINRGCSDSNEAKKFLNPYLKYLSSPFELKGIKESVDKIGNFINKGEKIAVYGDYDVDGITSTALLVQVLRYLNADVEYYIPDRIEEGYGLNIEALEQMVEKNIKLVITVDCGISAKNEIIEGQKLGLEFIVTDHHQPPEELPPCIIINPALIKEKTAWKNLSGVGVAFKLAQGLLEKRLGIEKGQEEVFKYLDLVALGTIADIVPLTGENRIIVKNGIERITTGERVGIKALCKVAKINYKNISSSQIGYLIAPRLNACGRIGDASLGVELLLSSSEKEALSIAEQLNTENQNRQNIEGQILKEALEMVERVDLNKEKVIVLASEKWHPGVIGIVASRIVEKFYRPTIILTSQEDYYKGSGRSIPGFHLYQALSQCQELLKSYGGHSQAAGLSLDKNNLNEFKKKINKLAEELLTPDKLVPVLELEGEINLADVDFNLLNEISLLEPFGHYNPEPVLVYRRGEVINCKEVGTNKEHLKLRIKAGQTYWDAIGFKMKNYLEISATREPLDFAFSLDKNEWNGKTSLQLVLKDIKPYNEKDDPHKTLSFLDELFLNGTDYLQEDIYKDINNKESFYTKVVGVTFNNRQDLIKKLDVNDCITLEREYENEHDPNAIKVCVREKHLGYLKRELAKHLAKNLDNGVEYQGVISQITGGNDDKNYGVNIFLKKFDKEQKDKSKKLKLIKDSYSKLSNKEVRDVIRKAIIGDYDYRPKQLETLKFLEEGNNTLAILGTGRGKSAIFQTRAAYLALKKNKITLIIYPLRSLVNDQFISLKNKLEPLGLSVFKATGSLESEEKLEFFKELENKKVDIVLTTPEFLVYNQNKFISLVDNIGLVVIDECHHLASRRTGYKLINKVLSELNNPQILAVTATADENICKKIHDKLSIKKLVIDPFVRENLKLIDSRGCNDKIGYIKNILLSGERTVVYVNSRKVAYTLAADLRREVVFMKDKIGYYHGGLNSEDRQIIENMFRKGELQLIVTTSAFGEGIDIPDIQNVVLYHLCFSKEEYNQLAGRAGRNGSEAKIHLLYGEKDKELNNLLLAGVSPTREQLGMFYILLKKLGDKSSIINLTNAQIAEFGKVYKVFGLQEKTVSIWLGILEELGLIEREGQGNSRTIFLNPSPNKVSLEKSIRYLEGLEEKRNFEEYIKIAYYKDPQQLLNLINRPIYPKNINDLAL